VTPEQPLTQLTSASSSSSPSIKFESAQSADFQQNRVILELLDLAVPKKNLFGSLKSNVFMHRTSKWCNKNWVCSK
jgi:hypothetical protein